MSEYEIFKACFPELMLTEEQFDILTEKKSCRIIRDGEAAAIVKKKEVLFLAVAPSEQGKGKGKALLKKCEEYIKENGYDEVVLNGLFPGATDNSEGFFLKRGYTAGGEFVEMGMDITGFRSKENNTECGVSYEFYNGEHSKLISAVEKVIPDWIQYFTENESVLCGMKNGEVASFCIIGEDKTCLLSDEKSKVGSIGCVGTVPEYRKQGIGLTMVEKGTEYLKEKGCDKCFIHYTHLENWYRKLGYKTFLRFTPMSKKL